MPPWSREARAIVRLAAPLALTHLSYMAIMLTDVVAPRQAFPPAGETVRGAVLTAVASGCTRCTSALAHSESRIAEARAAVARILTVAHHRCA